MANDSCQSYEGFFREGLERNRSNGSKDGITEGDGAVVGAALPIYN